MTSFFSTSFLKASGGEFIPFAFILYLCILYVVINKVIEPNTSTIVRILNKNIKKLFSYIFSFFAFDIIYINITYANIINP